MKHFVLKFTLKAIYDDYSWEVGVLPDDSSSTEYIFFSL